MSQSGGRALPWASAAASAPGDEMLVRGSGWSALSHRSPPPLHTRCVYLFSVTLLLLRAPA